LLVSLIAISIYITIRFDRKYALYALVALFHDLFIVFGIFSWLGIILSIEVNSLFAVSLLTIAGYSVNDTVVIFDRIREKLRSSNQGYNETIQLSVNESFRRTTFTSITTLIPLLTLILFGSYSLFWFSVSLSLGIIVGSYSSILLAPSFLLND
jgi:preprotein translocase subunit SecF